MKHGHRLSHLPLRAATGAFILNSGLQKWSSGDDEAAGAMHGMAANSYPFLKEIEPKKFVRYLATAEIGIGSALLFPIVPPALAGLALAGFSGGLVGLYLKTPGMRQEGSLRPTQQGTAIAKDSWMLGIGTALVLDGLTGGRKAKAKAKAKANAKAKAKREKKDKRGDE